MSFTDFGSTDHEGKSRIRPHPSQTNSGNASANLDRALSEVGDLLTKFQVRLLFFFLIPLRQVAISLKQKLTQL